MKKLLIGLAGPVEASITIPSFLREMWKPYLPSYETVIGRCLSRYIVQSVRGLDTLTFWKGLEFRTFLLYIGPVVLKDILPEDAYSHFLQLFCAIRICSCQRLFNISEYVQVADSLIRDFIEEYICIYGIDSISSNVHNLSHLIDDVKRFGILPKISAYPFENMLYFLKNLVRTGGKSDF